MSSENPKRKNTCADPLYVSPLRNLDGAKWIQLNIVDSRIKYGRVP